jgi:hypothetical protein
MSDAPIREWRFYLDDMIGFAENVIAYSDGFGQSDFVASGLNYDATVRNLVLIAMRPRISRMRFGRNSRKFLSGSWLLRATS